MISTTASYALRATVFLASQPSGFSSRTEIAEATVIPREYLLKVLNELDRAGLVESRRGPGGGYRLIESPDKVTALQVVTAVDNIPRITECPLGFSDHIKLCPLHALLDKAGRLVEEAFREATISKLIPKQRPSKSCTFPKRAT